MTEVVEAGSRGRTRRAILDAAVRVLSRRPGASLAEVAEAAEVGRTTLHRYFPERTDLLDAMSAEAVRRLGDALDRARPSEGSGREALVRACRELFDLGDLLTFVFTHQVLFEDRPEWRSAPESDAALATLVARGHADGSIDPALSASWVQSLLWSLLYTADAHVRDGPGSRHDALDMAVRSLGGAVRPSS